MVESMNHDVDHQEPRRGAVAATGVQERSAAPNGWPEVPETEPGLRRPWAWYTGGALLLIGGVLLAIGGVLHWWGPIPDVALRVFESDWLSLPRASLDVAWSSDFATAGYGLIAAAFIVLTALPWRGRGVLPRLSLVWAAFVFVDPVLYLLAPQAADASATSGATMIGAVRSMLILLSPGFLWAVGVLPFVLTGVASYPPFLVRRAPLLFIAAFALMIVAAPIWEMAILEPFSNNLGGDPTGYGVLSAMAFATSGALLLIVARLNARE